MNKQELHDFIGFRQPNICQIVAYKDGVEVYTDEWNGYKKDDTYHIMSATKSGSIIYGTDESELILQPHFHFRY